jgi:hypothetical protein
MQEVASTLGRRVHCNPLTPGPRSLGANELRMEPLQAIEHHSPTFVTLVVTLVDTNLVTILVTLISSP